MTETTQPEHAHKPLILLTGATGYVGGRLLSALSEQGHRVRCLVRRPERFRAPQSASPPELIHGDVLNESTLPPALQGADTAYYLLHSMGTKDDFEAMDRRAAGNFAKAAKEASLRRIIYLGGLADPKTDLSAHMRSRHEVGDILRESGAQVTEFRASIIIGSGSISFEMIRALVERLPVMTPPRWVTAAAQPLSIDDVLAYLVQALDLPPGPNRTFEIGGADRVSYLDLIREYARQRHLRRLIIRVPFLTARLSSLWLGFVTPFYTRVGRRLIDSLRNSSVVTDHSALDAFDIQPRGYREAVSGVLSEEERRFAQNPSSQIMRETRGLPIWSGTRIGNRVFQTWTARTDAPPDVAFGPIQRIGGKNGWYYANWLWWLRGLADRMVGGYGMKRGRRDPEYLAVGDFVDCWRVEVFEPNRRLRLHSELRFPGRAWLEFEVEPEDGGSQIRQTLVFDPIGLPGLLYWNAVYTIHNIVYSGLLHRLTDAAQTQHDS